MTEEIKLSKFDNQPWGFRLVGGKDFSTPLTVVKVTAGSLAEGAGMRAGDIFVAINEKPLQNLTHWEAHEVIIQAGNNFVLSVVRNSPALPQTKPASMAAPPPSHQMPNMYGQPTIQNQQTHMIQQLPKELSVEEQFDILYKEGQARSTNTFQQIQQSCSPHLISPEIPQLQTSVVSAENGFGTNMYQYASQQEYSHQSQVTKVTEEARKNIDNYLHQKQNLQQMYPQQQCIQQDQFEMQQVEQLWPKHQQQIEMMQHPPEKNVPQQHPQPAPSFHKMMPPEEMFTEDYIAEIMSGNAEVIMGNTIGVNFNKFKREPKIDHLSSSSVLQLLQEEKSMKGVMK
ncbi:PDZ and LIM domain protein Zasp [Anabrus simplex]|uniref:PDZ and LIM domain protein Zasp n=1 Tax=Anabrus simplex TaxID=316456 RepID=UPI0035A3BF6B